MQTVMACQAGKDVYVEKPLSLTIKEGRAMVDAARKNNRVVQTGSQQRSGAHYAKAVKMIRDGALGGVHRISAGNTRNAGPELHRARDEQGTSRLGHVARPFTRRRVRPVPLHLQLPLVLGLLRRADDQLGCAPPRHHPLGARRQSADECVRRGRALLFEGRRRDARRAGSHLHFSQCSRHVDGQRSKRRTQQAGRILRHKGHDELDAWRLQSDARSRRQEAPDGSD
ncbi:MAG: Gfo/Idh/MocA family oxidoreductase [Pyrinomonadaceae bacterium]|nr:Gfo/Idh/MocA family oxidoreductase [Pyrinomonadaceae bacterium]